MAAPKDDPMMKMFNDKDFTKMYAEGAEKFTRYYAAEVVQAAKVDQYPAGKELDVLDLACGTGIVSKELVDVLSDQQKSNLNLTCADFADSMLDFVGPRIKTFGIKSAEAVKTNANDLKSPSNSYTHIFLNFGPMIFTDGLASFRELHRLLRPSGVLAMTSWKKVAWLEDVRAAFESDPEIPQFPTDEEFRQIMNAGGIWDDAQWIKDNLAKTGFVDVEAREVSHSSAIAGVEEFSRLMSGMVGMIQQRNWTEDQRTKYKARADKAVVSYMQNKYGNSPIEWSWIAIVTTAKKAE